MADEPSQHERRDAAGRAADLERMAAEHADATWGDTNAGRAVVPGIISGDLGPKGRVAAQLRDLSRAERSRHGEVPRGTVAQGGARLVLLPLLLIVLAIVAVVVLIFWWALA